MFGSGNNSKSIFDTSPGGGGSIFDNKKDDDKNKSVMDSVFDAGPSSIFDSKNDSKTSLFDSGSGGMSSAFGSPSDKQDSIFGGSHDNKKFEARGMEVGNEDKYKAAYLVGDSNLASLNVRGSNYGQMNLLNRMRGEQANHLNMETDAVSLSEQYSDASLDKRAMDGMYNTTLSDVHGDKTKFAAHFGLMTDGKIDITDKTYAVDTFAENKKEKNTLWGSDYNLDLDKTLEFGLKDKLEKKPTKGMEFDNGNQSSILSDDNKSPSSNEKYDKIIEDQYQERKKVKKQMQKDKDAEFMKKILAPKEKVGIKEEKDTRSEFDKNNGNFSSGGNDSILRHEKDMRTRLKKEKKELDGNIKNSILDKNKDNEISRSEKITKMTTKGTNNINLLNVENKDKLKADILSKIMG